MTITDLFSIFTLLTNQELSMKPTKSNSVTVLFYPETKELLQKLAEQPPRRSMTAVLEELIYREAKALDLI